MVTSSAPRHATRSRTKQLIGAGLAIAIAISAWLGYDWLQTKHQEMSLKPAKSASAITFSPRESTIVASLAVPYSVIQKVVNDEAAKVSGTRNGSNDIKCVEVFGSKNCLTINWTMSYSPSGQITVGRSGDLVRATLPAQFSGGAGFGGDIASILSLSRKNVAGSFVVTADASVRLDERFCPRLVPGPVTFRWVTPAHVELIGKNEFRIAGFGFDVGPWSLDVGSLFTGQIQEQLNTAMKSAGQAIPCDPIRAELAKVWRRYSVPLNKENPPVFLHAEPIALSTSGLLAEDQGLRLVAMLKTKALLANLPGKEVALGELPAHVQAPPQPGSLSLALPLQVNYAVLQAVAMKEIAGKSFDVKGPGGITTVTLKRVELYPSGKNITVGVEFSADLPRRIFDTSGTVWLSAQPAIDPGGKVLRLKNVAATRQLDSALWSSLSALFQQTINTQIQRAAHYDLTADEANARQALQTAIANPAKTGGVRFTVTDPSITMGRIHMGENAFTIEALFVAKWDAVLEDIKL